MSKFNHRKLFEIQNRNFLQINFCGYYVLILKYSTKLLYYAFSRAIYDFIQSFSILLAQVQELVRYGALLKYLKDKRDKIAVAHQMTWSAQVTLQFIRSFVYSV